MLLCNNNNNNNCYYYADEIGKIGLNVSVAKLNVESDNAF